MVHENVLRTIPLFQLRGVLEIKNCSIREGAPISLMLKRGWDIWSWRTRGC